MREKGQSEKQPDSAAVVLMKCRLDGFETEEGRLKGLSYKPKPNDVAISTTPKAGTTWLQQICHQLRSASNGGDMSFSEISEVVPWLELAADIGQDLEAPQYGDDQNLPRFFKTHAWNNHCPRFAKNIIVLRNPYDVLNSFYNFFEDWFFRKGTVSIEEFAHDFWLNRGVPSSRMENASYFVHLKSWYLRKSDPSVLILFFEDLKDDLEAEIRKIARFVSNDEHNFVTNESIKHATATSTYNFMKTHESKFDEKLTKRGRNEACGLPKDAGMKHSKIVNGEQGRGKRELPDSLKKAIDKKWKEVLELDTGCANYEELREKFKSN